MKFCKPAAILAASLILVTASACGSAKVKAPTSVELSSGSYTVDTDSITAVLTSDDLALLDSFTALASLDATGSTCTDELAAWAAEHPSVSVTYSLSLPDGSAVSNTAESIDLSALKHSDVQAAADTLSRLSALKSVNLGSNTDGTRDLTLDDVKLLEEAAPGVSFDYSLTAFGKTISLSDTELDLNHITMDDNGEAVRQLLAVMPDCTYLDMDSCGVDDEHMAAIRDDFPNVKVVWRIWFGESYSVRTDVEKILASRPSIGGLLNESNCQSLKYCTDCKYLDIGHNGSMDYIDFLAYMPKLEVCIIAMIDLTDLSPIANCTNLEYLEVQSNPELSDLSPLANLTNLKHLNIANLPMVTDMTALYGMTQLERLWIGCITPVPDDQIAQMQSIVPNCTINTNVWDPTDGGWRYDGGYVDEDEVPHSYLVERYQLLVDQFEYDKENEAFAFYWNDPLYYGSDTTGETY